MTSGEMHAFDISSFVIDELNSYRYENCEKIHCECSTLADYLPKPGILFDTLLMCEIIEHVSLDDELAFLSKIRGSMNDRYNAGGKLSGANFVVSTPIGFMPDPTHCRGFSRREFGEHVSRHYGNINGMPANCLGQLQVKLERDGTGRD